MIRLLLLVIALKPMDSFIGLSSKADSQPRDFFYQILGCDRSSNDEQISREYKLRALATHPDKNRGHDAEQSFKLLLNAKEVLTDPNRRKLYDRWIDSGILMPFEKWERLSQNTQMTMHWMNNTRKQAMIEPKSPPKPVWERECSFTLDDFRNYRI